MFWFIFVVSCLLWAPPPVSSSVINTSSGPVLGKLVHDGGVSSFCYLGIPYGESPVGELRFKPPIPKKPWKELLNATENGKICPQAEGSYTKDEMSEDCLSINICVPATKVFKWRPVYFYIHGGSFKSNTGNIDVYGPKYFLERDVIYVSVNYSHATPLLSLQTDDVPGNAGIKDVILALKWVKENIKNFGGTTVTIGGQSSGAGLVHYLLLTEKTSGLFDRAILESGSALNPRFFTEYPTLHARALADELGFGSDDIESMSKNLITADVFDIVKAQENVYKNNRNIMRPFAPFVPCIEKESSHAVLTKHPKEIIESGIPQNVPLLTGITSREGIYMWSSLMKNPVKELQEKFTLCIPYNIEYPKESNEYKALVKSMTDLYFGGSDLSNWTDINFYDLISDTQYAQNVDLWLRTHTQRIPSKPVYYYEFDFDGDLNYAKIGNDINFPGTAHADDLGYLFITKVTESNLDKIDSKTQKTLSNVLKFFTNFIKLGNPTPAGILGPVFWPSSGRERYHLLLNDDPKTKFAPPFKTRFDFWSNVYIQYDKYLENGGKREPRIAPDFPV